ncbi:MAG: hypothetical protein NC935_07540 [Candidatus Omnitrophica bacterium]|nr:hypothetical protein [Candidatus Omnitrophota bacterium]
MRKSVIFSLILLVIFFIISNKPIYALYGAGPNCKVVAVGNCQNGIWSATCQGCECDIIDSSACQSANKSSCLSCTFSCSVRNEPAGQCNNPPTTGICQPCGAPPPPPPRTPTSTPTPTPTPYPTVVIYGLLKEYSEAMCYNNISSDNLSITIEPSFPNGIIHNCGITPPTEKTKSSYRCTIIFNNQNAAPTPIQDFFLKASANEYQSAYWTDNNVCNSIANNKISVNVAVENPPTAFNKDIFFQIASWIKLKNASFISSANFINIIPLNISPYDNDDTTNRYFIIGETGLVAANGLNMGTANISSKKWLTTGYSKQTILSTTNFLEYVRSRKKYQEITDITQIKEGINLYQGDLTININNQVNFNDKKTLLIVTGTTTIDIDNFQPNNGSVAIIASNINFTNDTKSAKGIFIGQTINTGTTTNDGLKIIGNLIANAGFFNGRKWENYFKPSLFIVFEPKIYLDLLPYLSISKYDWQQIQ